MAKKFYVEMSISFQGEIVAESQAEAEELAWTSWGETADAQIQYDGVESIHVSELGDLCDECGDMRCDCNAEPCDCGCDTTEGEGEA